MNQLFIHASLMVNQLFYLAESTEETFWPNVYRVVGIMAFVITVLTVWVASSCGCKGENFLFLHTVIV